MIRILVPSYGRAGRATTMRMLPSAEIVVPESQRESYEKAYPGRVVVIPDDMDGNIARKRNAILDLLDEDEACFMVDDDLMYVQKLMHGRLQDIEQSMEIFANLAEDAQAWFGGFSTCRDPAKMAEYAPFSLTKPSYQCVYIRNDPELRYDEQVETEEDADIYLQYMLKHRSVLRDNRYFFSFMCNQDIPNQKAQAGGIEYDMQKQRQVLKTLRMKWGNLIKVKDGKMNGVHPPIPGI